MGSSSNGSSSDEKAPKKKEEAPHISVTKEVSASIILQTDSDAMFEAVAKDDIYTVEELIKKNCDIVHIKDGVGNTPLNVAALYGHANMIRLLIDNGANPNVRNREGYFSLKIAIKNDFNLFVTGDKHYRKLMHNKPNICLLNKHSSLELRQEGIEYAQKIVNDYVKPEAQNTYKKFLIYPLICNFEPHQQLPYSDFVRRHGNEKLRKNYFSPKKHVQQHGELCPSSNGKYSNDSTNLMVT